MKGILLAGGSGSRLFPLTASVNKHLLPIFDKPMIYYSLSVLMLAGIREILIITNPHDTNFFRNLLGNGQNFGLSINYEIQNSPNGIAEAFIIGEKFIGNDNCCLVLGDNIFFGHSFSPLLKNSANLKEGAIIYGYQVYDPSRFGVVEFDNLGNVLSIEEKPSKPKSSFAITGLYFFDNDVINIAKNLKPSARGELEISDVNNEYLSRGQLKAELLGRGFAWLDTGTHKSLNEASNFISAVESRQGFKIACIEEIAFLNGWIDKETLKKAILRYGQTDYSKYLANLIN